MTVDNYREAFKWASIQRGKESDRINSKQRSQKLHKTLLRYHFPQFKDVYGSTQLSIIKL